MKTSEVLRKAADEIRRRGWHQEDMGADFAERDNCPVCAWGAINAAQNGDPWDWYVEDAPAYESPAKSALERIVVADGEYSVPSWNDDPNRTVDEVLAKFEEAAQKAEADGD